MLAIISTLALCAAASVSAASGGIIANYYPAYGSQSLNQMPWGYSDMAFYFLMVTNKTGFAIPEGQVDPKAFVAKAHKEKKKALFTIGGWTGGLDFSNLVSTANSRNSFASQIASYMKANQFDGVDIDWEYPGQSGVGCNSKSPQDSANYALFLATLRKAVGKKLITAAVTPTGLTGADGNPLKDASVFGKYLDYITIMQYDVYGPGWSQTTGPNGPLTTCNPNDPSAYTAIAYWTGAGFPAKKILLGVPSYSYAFTTLSSKLNVQTYNGVKTLIYQPSSSVVPKGDSTDVKSTSTDPCGVTSTGYSGNWHYHTMISDGILSADGSKGLKGFTRHWDKCTSTPFLFNPQKKYMIPYDDAVSVKAKAKFAKDKGLAGITIFDSTGFNTAVYKAARV